MSVMESSLNIGYVYPSTKALGPGTRYVLWLRGCHRCCPGCASPELRMEKPAKWVSINIILQSIISTGDIDGITISGGEPLLQSKALGQLLYSLRKLKPELSIILYTGYSWEDIPQDATDHVIPFIDLLIDGVYVDSLNDGKGLRGSSNQKFHYLTDKLIPFQGEIENGKREREIHLLSQYEVLTIGIPPKVSRV